MTPSSPTEALAEALKKIVEIGTRNETRRISDPYSDGGWENITTESDEAEIARDALAAYAASQAEAADVPAVAPALNAWNWLAKHRNAELSYRYGEEGEDGVWQVHRINGGINDREWRLIGEGPTPLEAVLAAMAAAGGE